MADNWWDDDEVVAGPDAPIASVAAPPAVPRVIQGAPKPNDPPSGYRWAGGGLEAIPGGPGDKEQGRSVKQIPDGAAKRLEDQVTAVASFERFRNTFRPDYAGIGSSVENAAQAFSPIPIGTEGQRDWWADFKLADATLRNQLFGASLTGNEKQSWKETTVSPDMSAAEVKRNMDRRMTLAKQILVRRGRFMKANKYDPDAVSALMGEYDPDANPMPQTQDDFEPELHAALTDPDLSPEERLTAANDVSTRYQRAIGQKEAAAAAQAGQATTHEDPSLLQQAGSSLANVAAGVAEGAAALPDMAARGMGELMALPADWLGYDNVAAQLRGTPQIGRAIESVVPVPQDWNNWSARQVARLEGGALGVPMSAQNALAERIVGKVPPRPPGPMGPSNTQFLDDTKALGIEPTMAAAGGPVSGALTSAVAKTVGGARPTVAAAQRMLGQGRNALARIAGREGDAVHPESMGEGATSGALKYRSASRNDVAQIYDKATQVAGDTRVMADDAVKTMDEHIAHFDQVPGGSDGAAYLKGLRDELVNKFPDGVTVAGIRGMRTVLRDKFYKDGLRGSDIERRVNEVVDAIGRDLETSLTEAGKSEAATLFRQADDAWAVRADTLDNIIMPIIGKKGEKTGEQVAAALESAARGKGAKFDRFLRALPQNAAGDARSTILTGLGKATAGNQSAAGDAFSYGTFLKNWNLVGPTARKALFAQGDREAMDKLARVAERVGNAEKYANWSNTGSNTLNAATLYWMMNEPVSSGLFIGGTYSLGRVLASPGAARALAKISAASSPAEAKSAVAMLGNIAARNPAAANDILGLQAQIQRAMGSPATAAAAEEQEQVR